MSESIDEILKDARVHDGVLDIEFFYPRSREGAVAVVELGLCDVRAADSIRISYDFERDGYSIKQASVFQWRADDPVMDSDWQEVAFIAAWARKKESEG